ncbi:CDP-alcohol phosphatidyltransferase family protein [Candidatus Saccharibacteria bacterium]|nr:CDP-alcohol phosphatidyltransferase family protein [Candidatus Saccharibacteria bacterium]
MSNLVGTCRTFFAWLIEPLAVALEPHKETIWVKNIPNAMSVLRCVLAVVVDWQIYHATSNYGRAACLVVIVVLILSDGYDGALARRLKIESTFGALADPFADKILIGGLVIGLSFKFDSILFGGLVVLLLGFELGNMAAGFIGGRLAKRLNCPEQIGAGKWGKLKFGVECLLVVLGWTLLHTPAAFSISSVLIMVAIWLASRSFFGYLHKIKLARAIPNSTATSHKIPTPY